MVDWEPRADGVLLRCADLSVRVAWQARGILRVAARPADDGDPVLNDGPMLDPDRALGGVELGSDFVVRESDSELIVSDGTLALHVDLRSGAFSYRDADGSLLFEEPCDDGKRLQARADTGYRARLRFAFSEGEALYGLGQHEEGRLDYRGRSQYLYQHNLKASVPFLISSRGWGLLWQGYSAMTFRDDAFGCYLDAECVEELDYFVIAGAALDDVIRGYRLLTGAAPIPPRWAFGYIQSTERYKDQKELLDTAERYAELGLPLECIVLDWQYWPEGQWGQKTLEPERFPDLEAMCDRLHELGTRLMISVWPHMHGESADQLEFRAAGKLLANGFTYDAFDPEARALFWRQAETAMFSKGVDAWWSDCSEPFEVEADWSGDVTLEPTPEERMRINVEEAARYLGPEKSNAYSLMHATGIWENQRASGSTKRVFNLTRSAYAGQQRYGTVTWSGDVSASWDTLRRQIADGLNFCASGLPYWTTDIGAFFVGRERAWFKRGEFDAGVEDLGYRELFLRWFQYAAFLPVFRAHGTGTPREIWHYGEPGSVVYDSLVRFIKLRKALVPYLYSLAAAVHRDGYTMMRPLAFDFGDDPEALRVEDQFMLGSALLVCPVTAAQRHGPGSREITGAPTTRPVYLPAGSAWVDVWSGRHREGGTWLDAEAPLETIPVFARAGSIIPLVGEHTVSADLDLLVVSGADGTFEIYEDEGDGWGYENGANRRIPVRWLDADGTLVIGDAEGGYNGAPQRRTIRARLIEHGRGWDQLTDDWDVIDYQGSEMSAQLSASRRTATS
ncbi:MAG: hypothetical protein AUG49_02695 [Catenulispora sp. 13_1_20CM_3_70_7]|nr:MAG: hypothetical protein AUG49_02695 [Catenulispora sp. 13_1_20CM_3_70_7]